jgi:5-methyltetrahydropteroyltriglutamate--homocysteine methyltransferase
MTMAERDDLKNLRVDQIGGLRAPAALREAFERHRKGEVSAEQFIALREALITEMIAKQESLGIPIVTDGELRRTNFQDSFNEAVIGFDKPPRLRFPGENQSALPFTRTQSADWQRWRAAERLRLVRNIPLEEYLLSEAVASRPVKVTLLSADRIAERFDAEGSRQAYRDLDDFLDHVVAIERQMIAELVAAGCRYIQIDAPGYTSYVDAPSLDAMRARGEDPERRLARSIAADNAVIAGFEDVVFGLHICRGGARTIDLATGRLAPQWHREGHYDAIAERLFSELKHDRLLLEYDSDRAGGFAPLRFIAPGKIAVLGLVTTKSAELESVASLKRRIDEASRHIPVEQLALSPQCGFGGYRKAALEEDLQWRKFEAILATAEAVWG